jgi:hypothetical protein
MVLFFGIALLRGYLGFMEELPRPTSSLAENTVGHSVGAVSLLWKVHLTVPMLFHGATLDSLERLDSYAERLLPFKLGF